MDWNKIKTIVYKNLDQASEFKAILGFFDAKKKFKNPLRKDDNPSCSFYLNKIGAWVFHDFASGEHLDLIALIMQNTGMTFQQTIINLAIRGGCLQDIRDAEFEYKEEDRTKIESLLSTPLNSVFTNKRLALLAESKKEKKQVKKVKSELGFTQCEWSSVHIKFATERGWPLHPFIRLFPVKDFFYKKEDGSDGKLIGNERDGQGIIFRFANVKNHAETGDGQFYRPFATDKKQKFRSFGSPHFILEGPKFDNRWIYAKSYKEAFNLNALNFNVLGVCGEDNILDTDLLRETITRHKIKEIFVLGDNDAKGLELLVRKVRKVKEQIADFEPIVYGFHIDPLRGKDLDEYLIGKDRDEVATYINTLIETERDHDRFTEEKKEGSTEG